jgi:hypothetical protein
LLNIFRIHSAAWAVCGLLKATDPTVYVFGVDPTFTVFGLVGQFSFWVLAVVVLDIYKGYTKASLMHGKRKSLVHFQEKVKRSAVRDALVPLGIEFAGCLAVLVMLFDPENYLWYHHAYFLSHVACIIIFWMGAIRPFFLQMMRDLEKFADDLKISGSSDSSAMRTEVSAKLSAHRMTYKILMIQAVANCVYNTAFVIFPFLMAKTPIYLLVTWLGTGMIFFYSAEMLFPSKRKAGRITAGPSSNSQNPSKQASHQLSSNAASSATSDALT